MPLFAPLWDREIEVVERLVLGEDEATIVNDLRMDARRRIAAARRRCHIVPQARPARGISRR